MVGTGGRIRFEVIRVGTAHPNLSWHGHDVSAFEPHAGRWFNHRASMLFKHALESCLFLFAVFHHARHDKGAIDHESDVARENLIESEWYGANNLNSARVQFSGECFEFLLDSRFGGVCSRRDVLSGLRVIGRVNGRGCPHAIAYSDHDGLKGLPFILYVPGYGLHLVQPIFRRWDRWRGGGARPLPWHWLPSCRPLQIH